MSTERPWYVVVQREEVNGEPWHDGNVVIGPFATEAEAAEHGNESLEVLDWLTEEAKLQGYIATEAYWTQDLKVPAHGINTPSYDPEGE